MTTCVLLCEYNPFHTGHRYQLEQIRNHGVDNTVCIMSGNFVQSAMPAFCDKSLRAKAALLGGANAVIELPTVYATASAEYFAQGAVKIAAEIKGVKYFAMGAVCEADDLLRITELKTDKSELIAQKLKEHLRTGKSYNAAMTASICEIYSSAFPDKPSPSHIFEDPNNILCLEYLYALRKFAPSIEPLIIKRQGAAYNDTTLTAAHISATAIRDAVARKDTDTIRKYVPYCLDEMLEFRCEHSPNLDAFKRIAAFSVKCAPIDYLSTLRDCSEGMEYLIKGSRIVGYDDLIEEISGKRYGKKRIARLLLDAVLDIRSELTDFDFETRLLGCKKDFDFTALPNRVKTNNSDIKNAAESSEQIKRVLEVDLRAAALYNAICGVGGDYFSYSIVKA